MLVSFVRFRIVTIWSTHPIQSAISVLPQTPGIVQRCSVLTSTPKNNHHTAGRSCSTYASRMVDSRRRVFKPSVYFLPNACTNHIDFPDISDSFRASVASIYYHKRFKVGHDMTITGSRSCPLAVFDFPICFITESKKIQLIEVIVCQLSSSQSSSKYVEKVVN